MSKNRDKQATKIEGGQNCTICGKPTQRFEHSDEWKPLPGRGAFRYWDVCSECQRIQNYSEAHIKPVGERMPRTNVQPNKRELNIGLDAALMEKRIARQALRSGRSFESQKSLNEKRSAHKAKRKAAKKARREARVERPIMTVPKQIRGPSIEAKKSFYQSWEWRTLRMEVLKTFGHRCQSCGAAAGEMTIGGTPIRIVVDHIKPLSKFWNLRLDRGNLQVLCDECNMGKGAWDQTDYRPVNNQTVN